MAALLHFEPPSFSVGQPRNLNCSSSYEREFCLELFSIVNYDSVRGYIFLNQTDLY